MTHAELLSLLKQIGWTLHALAARSNYASHLVRRWGQSEHTPVPPDIAAWLTEAAVWFEAHPVPRRGETPSPVAIDRRNRDAEILRLHTAGWTATRIAAELKIGRELVARVLERG
jgi:DNA-binding NarL/FixJ family response regulator